MFLNQSVSGCMPRNGIAVLNDNSILRNNIDEHTCRLYDAYFDLQNKLTTEIQDLELEISQLNAETFEI